MKSPEMRNTTKLQKVIVVRHSVKIKIAQNVKSISKKIKWGCDCCKYEMILLKIYL